MDRGMVALMQGVATSKGARCNMIHIYFSTELHMLDPLMAARGAINQALLERIALELKQPIRREIDDRFNEVRVESLDKETADELLARLEQIQILDDVAVDVSTDEELSALSRYAAKVALGVVDGW
jgi:hypothetical protein